MPRHADLFLYTDLTPLLLHSTTLLPSASFHSIPSLPASGFTVPYHLPPGLHAAA